MASPNADIITGIFNTYRSQGHLDYGESVKTIDHMLQAAVFAERDNAHDTLIAAAFLHDIGHLVHGLSEDIAERGIDGLHEDVGADWLARWFRPSVSEPARLHVVAKRYLCAVEPDYFEGLSPSSVRSLELQGGPFKADEIRHFEAHPHFADAVLLRRYDDFGKVPGMETPDFEHYRPVLRSGLLKPSPTSGDDETDSTKASGSR
ncbi:MAG: HD domain-containing protein [Candidatus Latescibacterota bacterium]|nr:HD domain-containing protein [Candidatus Latescibacterota bacterium]